ncbi:hypothetical protein LTR66_002978 [Elasticomyces elasticus]|nr:hypothetical protein LTR66_002978 [Elasticomyces elasticus]
MEQTRALNALAPYLALSKSANSPRAAVDLIGQATSAPHTYVFAELLQAPTIQALRTDNQYAGHYRLLEIFAWGTWEEYHMAESLPSLSDAQSLKLRLLTLLTVASRPSHGTNSALSYPSLQSALSLSSPLDLEHVITTAIYNNLITATISPSTQTVNITSIAPLRDLAPGSIPSLISTLSAWSGRCDAVLADLEAEIAAVKKHAYERKREEKRRDAQIKAARNENESPGIGESNKGVAMHNTRSSGRPHMSYDSGNGWNDVGGMGDDDEDAMDVDAPGGGGRKKRGPIMGMMNKFKR